MEKIFYEFDADKNDYFWTWHFNKNYTPPHFHKSLELIYCVKGTMSIFINKRHYALTQNEMCFIPSYTIHSNRYLDEENEMHSFLFAHNFFHDFEKSFPQKKLPFLLLKQDKNLKIYDELMKIFSIYSDYDYNGNNVPFLQRQALINDLLLKLTQIYPLISSSEVKEDHNVIEVLRFINQNFKEELSLPIIAKHFDYSPKYFSDFFIRNVGCSLTAYLHNIRIKNVLMQMEDPNNKQPISALAFENGFNSLATFYRVLKQYKQQLPTPPKNNLKN